MPYESLFQISENIAEVVHAPGPSFLLIYAPDYDTVCHLYGPMSAMADYHAGRIDRLIEAVLPVLPRDGRTTLLVTADPGQVQLDPSRAVYLQKLPGFAAHLLAPPAGDRMARYLSLRPAAERSVRETLEGIADLLPAADLWREGFFGDVVRRTLPEDIGDLIALPHPGSQLLWCHRAQEEEPWLGGHGGLSAEEMYVPLVVL
jgi:predicted AlkP superfamily pyrophosphatase or phosphodiesterase